MMRVEVVDLLKVQESHLWQSWSETIVVGRRTTPVFGEAGQAILFLLAPFLKTGDIVRQLSPQMA